MTALIKVSSSFLRLISFLSLSLLASPTFGAGPVETANAPAWRTATSLISDDGHAQLSWSVPAGEFADYWEVLESRPGKVGTTFYVDQPSVHVFRITPGRYDFRVRSCLRHSVDSTTCGQSSAKLRLLVTENAIPQPNRAAVSSNQSAAVERFGGPAQLRPGGWINPDKDGQGWYFYWANRLRYDEGDPLFGNAYDLVGIWYTFEAKSVYFDDEVCHCNIYDDYLPVTAELRLVSLSESGYTGGIWLTRNGEEIQVGSANLFFGPNNTSATLNWWANFKFEAIPATSESLINIVSNEPLQTDSNAHFSGQWRQPGNANYFIDELLTDTLEVINISFQDSAGDQTWIQATSGNPETSSVSFCAQYLNSGYRPDLVANNGSIYNHWYENGCDVDEIAHDFNRNGRRYFPELESGHFWATFSLPGGAYNSGSVAIGTESVPDVLQKTSNFQRVFYDPSLGSSCQLQTNGSCTLSLTWFTDGDHPDATVWVHDQASGSRTKFMTSTSPVMEDQQLVLTSAGEYEFELRMGDSVSSTLMARSTIFTVLDGSPNLPDTVGALHGRWVDKPAQEFDLAWRHSEPALVTHYEIQETNPDGSVTAPLIHVTGGNAIAWNFDKTGELPGQYQYRVRACNGQGCSEYTLPLNWYTQDPVNQASIFDDDFESSQGWTTDLDGTDTASTGQWERANPSTTSRLGTDYQLGTTVSGFQDLVTQAPAGSSWGSYDIDRGVTSITSPLLALPAGDDPLVLRFHYYFAHSSSAGSGDFFRAYIEAPGQDWLLLEELGDPAIDGGAWQEVGLDLTPWSGQSVRIRFEAADGADAGTIAEAGIDDVKLTAFGTPNAPPGITNPGAQSSNQNETITPLNLAVSDADGDTLSCSDGGTLPAGLGVAIDGGNANCVISGTLTAAASTYAVIITVDDGAGGHANTAFNWTVNDSGSSTNPEVPPAPAGPPNMSPSLSSSESGATPGHFRVDESGSARYSIPLLTAPGSGGLAPQITLEYSSQSGNGPLG
ncbi:MAG: hypothetical protein HKN15_09940, partial [Xanthomonadales bacterium]|nr:hypothetical protein [Xanthomonadales bacterium]